MQYKARHYSTGKAIMLETDGGRITAINDIDSGDGLPFAGPPLVDMQVNGYLGRDINDAAGTSPEDLRIITDIFLELGISYWLPTIITNSEESILKLLANVKEAIDSIPAVKRAVPGIHVEGPFITPDDGPRGAHDRRYVRAPDIEEYRRWQAACDNMIRIVTLGPEYDEAPAFIEALVADGVVASLGHCNADRGQIKRAVDAGASLATHLGNGAHPLVPRHHSYIWELLAEDRVWAGLIGDGFHLPQAQLQNFIRAKRVAKTVLTSDTVHLGGMEPGEYKLGDLSVRMQPEGKIVLADNDDIMAGASFHLLFSIQNAVKLAGRSPAEAWTMASINPAHMMRWNEYPDMTVGSEAVFALFNWTDDNQLRIEPIVDERGDH
ncbi:N-acetylglucosamine-6-phosphate deacetylase [Planctomycetota bacterium]